MEEILNNMHMIGGKLPKKRKGLHVIGEKLPKKEN
jgi:hypothetical protein